MTIRLSLFLTLLPFSLPAGGFNTCNVPQSQIATRAGVERPTSRAYDAVCVAVLPPACGDYVRGGKPCAYRACIVPDSVKACPNGEPTAFNAQIIQTFVAQSVKPITQEELAAMNHAIDAEAKRLAAKWTGNGRVPLSPGALTVLHNISCQLAAANNPDVRCVAR